MLRYKIIRAILVFLLIVLLSVIIFFFFQEEEQIDKPSEIDELKKPDRALIMKNPSIEWGEHRLSAEEMEVIKDSKSPQIETQLFRKFTFSKKNGNSSLEITGDSAAVHTVGTIESFTTIKMTGSVKCRMPNGWFIGSPSFTYDQSGILGTESAVTFGSENASGSADTFLFNNQLGKLLLTGNITLKIKPPKTAEDAEQPVIIKTESIEYDTTTGGFVISGGFLATKGDEFLEGKNIQGSMNPSTKKIMTLDVLDSARMCFRNITGTSQENEKKKENKESPFNFDGLKLITSPVIKFEFFEDEQNTLKSIRTVKPSSLYIYETSLQDKEKLRIFADEFGFLTDEQGSAPQKMTASGKVKIVQVLINPKSSYKRIISCESFDGLFDTNGAFTSIVLKGGLNITELNYTIESESGIYKSSNSTLIFSGAPMVQHKDGMSVAEIIKFDTARSLLRLEKNVVSRIKNSNSTDKVFTGKEDIYINADSMAFNSDKNSSLYKGKVKAYQGKSQVFSESLQLNQDDKTLIINGSASGRIYDRDQTTTAEEKKQEPAEEEKYIDFNCDKCTMDENNSFILFEKKAHIFRSTGEDIKGEKIKYTFKDKISQAIKTEASGKAIYKKAPYESNSDSLYYDVENDLITLKGGKVILFSGGKPLITARELTFKSAGDIINIKSLPGERIEAVWRTEDKAKVTQEVKKKK